MSENERALRAFCMWHGISVPDDHGLEWLPAFLEILGALVRKADRFAQDDEPE